MELEAKEDLAYRNTSIEKYMNQLKGITVEIPDAIDMLVVSKRGPYPLREFNIDYPDCVEVSAIGANAMLHFALKTFVVWAHEELGMKEGARFVVNSPDGIGPKQLFGHVLGNPERGNYQLSESDEWLECQLKELEDIN